ncbi:hypothetical protein LPJ60_006493, partial [Coemansia sp. RSA 2675]
DRFARAAGSDNNVNGDSPSDDSMDDFIDDDDVASARDLSDAQSSMGNGRLASP